ncbi:MAG TPA: methylated-DNA--[protein]-cysteine S-methyltransferase [Clostridiaceae bacterium]|nr:methylated-DNA--[protein]-cysteine S-methyltransferase [Clostridiaceae bacterium]
MKIIVACDRRWGIGSEGKLLTHISTDLKRFKEITNNNIVVYGRKTLATFPYSQPLANRINVILTSNPDFYAFPAHVVNSLQQLFPFLAKLKGEDADREVFVIGGASVYDQLLPYCDEVLLTEIDAEFSADSFFPDISAQRKWAKISETSWLEENGVRFRYVTYQKHRELRLKRLYLNDAAKIRELGLPCLTGSLREIRAKLNPLVKEAHSKMYTIYDDEELIGVARLAYPLLNSNLPYLSWQTLHSLTPADVDAIIDNVLEQNINILRLEVVAAEMLPESVKEEFTFGIALDDLYPAYRRSVYRPERSDTDIAFIPFSPFGYIVLCGGRPEGQITGVDFWREDEALSDPELLAAAKLLGLADICGRPVIKDNIIYVKRSEQRYLSEVAESIVAYLTGAGSTPEADYISLQATDFQRKVWQEIAKIPYGRISTYEEIAEKIAPEGENHRNYSRAVGNACGANPLPIIIPCHRVIGKNRSLVGFTGGLDIKDHLLNLEMQYAQNVR